jgi:predicted phage terminase large subunit-like protein
VSDLSHISTAELLKLQSAGRRIQAYQEAKESLLRYIQIGMPDPEAPDDITRSRYQVTPQARLLCEIMEDVERGKRKRVAVSIGPQLGKSEILTRAYPAWSAGRNPYSNLMIGTYNQTFAEEFGDEVRSRIESPTHQAIFSKHRLRKGAVNLLITEEGGKTAFVGVGGSGTGKPADKFIVDDPIRSDDDAQSQLYRDRIWKWFNSVVFTRCHGESGVVVVHTRWNMDDLIGRLCDPDHPERNKDYKGIADRWTYINLPAVVESEKLANALGLTLREPTDPKVISMFGSKPMSALWPKRKSLEFLAETKEMDARTFGALYMGKPSPDDGEYFKSDWLVEYHDPKDLPPRLKKYGASDHAVSEKQGRDSTVLGCIGVDEEDDIWVLPDLVWDKMPTNRTVEEMLIQFKTHKPGLWWMESELISKSFGPFLHERMLEEKIYVTIDPVTVSKDKQLRARAIQGRMSMKKVHFPAFAPWWSDARGQILRFPFDAHDDFVDWLSHIGMGLIKQVRPSREKPSSKLTVVGSPQWILRQTALRATQEKRVAANRGW